MGKTRNCGGNDRRALNSSRRGDKLCRRGGGRWRRTRGSDRARASWCDNGTGSVSVADRLRGRASCKNRGKGGGSGTGTHWLAVMGPTRIIVTFCNCSKIF
jgi:hypothetical protein